jgi:cytochrome oxidase Cu insertion factor (SCO1/SenC/PrrC family)
MNTSLRKNLILLFVGLAVGLGIGYAGLVFLNEFLPNQAKNASIMSPEAAPVKGATAPDFSLTTTTGELIQLSHLIGQPVVLNFWAT